MTKNEVIAALDKARAAMGMEGVTVRSLEMKLPDGKVIVFSNEQPAPDFPLTVTDIKMLDAIYEDMIAAHTDSLDDQLEAIQTAEATEAKKPTKAAEAAEAEKATTKTAK